MEMVGGEKSYPNFLFINQSCLSKTLPAASLPGSQNSPTNPQNGRIEGAVRALLCPQGGSVFAVMPVAGRNDEVDSILSGG